MIMIRKRGFAVIWALLTIFVLMVVSTTLATSIVKEAGISLNTKDSLKAYMAAQTGVDIASRDLVAKANSDCGASCPDTTLYHLNGTYDQATYQVDYSPSQNLISSVGKINNATRKIEYTVKGESTSALPNSEILAAASGVKSIALQDNFSIGFDFWRDPAASGTVSQDMKIKNISGGYLDANITETGNSAGNSATISLGVSNGTNTVSNVHTYTIPAGSSAYSRHSFGIELNYVYGSYASYNLVMRDSGLNPLCVYSYNMDISSLPAPVDLGAWTTLIFNNTASPVPLSLVSDSQQIDQVLESTTNFVTDSYRVENFQVGVSVHSLLVTTSVGGTVSSVSPDTGINCGADCSNSYPSGTSVILNAIPNSGYTFTGWGGACSGTGACAMTMVVDKTVTASFASSGGGGSTYTDYTYSHADTGSGLCATFYTNVYSHLGWIITNVDWAGSNNVGLIGGVGQTSVQAYVTGDCDSIYDVWINSVTYANPGSSLTSISNISGTPQVGQTLTAGALTPSGATASYQWQSASTSSGTYSNIAGATATTYAPVSGDVGKYIKVVATGSGSYSGSVTSAATSAVAAAVCVPSITRGISLNSPADGATVSPGNTTLTATASYIDANNCAGHTVYMQIMYNPAGTGTWYASTTYSGSNTVTGNLLASLSAGDVWWFAEYNVDTNDMSQSIAAPTRLLHVSSGGGSVKATFTSGSGSWQAPTGVTSVQVLVWGAGAGGSDSNGNGGGGGAFTRTTFSVTPGNSYNYSVGVGGNWDTNGGDSWFVNSATVLAKGGDSAGSGGQASACIPSSNAYSGGMGGNTGAGDWGGGGGGGAGSGGAGSKGVSGNPGTGGSGGAGTYPGGYGGDAMSTDGSIPGGGGGGYSTRGANGQILLIW